MNNMKNLLKRVLLIYISLFFIVQRSSIMGKFVLNEVNGDLFSATTSLAHCVGADFRMGMGIAVKFKSLFGGESELKKQNVNGFVASSRTFSYHFLLSGQNGRMRCASK